MCTIHSVSVMYSCTVRFGEFDSELFLSLCVCQLTQLDDNDVDNDDEEGVNPIKAGGGRGGGGGLPRICV